MAEACQAHGEEEYLNLVRLVLEKGKVRTDRTGLIRPVNSVASKTYIFFNLIPNVK